MFKTPFFNQTSKRLSVVITIWFLSYQISMAQLTCTQMSIDTMSVKIGLVDIGLKHVQHDTFRAYVYDKQGFSTFLFNRSTQQIASPVKTYKETYYDGLELISIFNTQPHNSSMRNTLNKVCRGIYHGPYSIVGVEEGFMENNLLNGTVTKLKVGNYGWHGTSSYVNGIKQGIEIYTNGRYTNRWFYKNGSALRLQVFKDSLLLRDERYHPTYGLTTYDDFGRLTRLEVQDSIYLYYENQNLRYSLTYNESKQIWETKLFYPSGKLEMYQPHKTYRHSPLATEIWYTESGQIKPEPEPEEMVEEIMEYQSLRSSIYNHRTTDVTDNQLLEIKEVESFLSQLTALLVLDSETKVKKKQLGSYQFELEAWNSESPKVYFQNVNRKDHTIYQHVHYTLEGLDGEQVPIDVLSNYTVTYLKALIDMQVDKP